MLTIALLTLALNPVVESTVAKEHVYAVERNWFTDESGEQLVFCQHIFWSHDPLGSPRMQVRAFRLVQVEKDCFDGWPCAKSLGPCLGTRMVWDDKGTVRDVTADFVFDSVTPFDVEANDLCQLRRDQRDELVPVKTKSQVRELTELRARR